MTVFGANNPITERKGNMEDFLCTLTEFQLASGKVLLGYLPSGDEVQVSRLRTVRGQRPQWELVVLRKSSEMRKLIEQTVEQMQKDGKLP